MATTDPQSVLHLDALDERRLRLLIEVGPSLGADLQLDSVLDRLLMVAREVTGARYAAVGVLDRSRHELERFVTQGIDDATRQTIGDLPKGHGVLGVLIREPKPLRLHDVSDHVMSYGFPPGHPQMRSFLGVPVKVAGEAWGNLYLTDKEGGFDADDEETATVLAAWAAVAVDNARLYTAVQGRREELERAVRGFEATASIAQAVGGETDLGRVLELITKRGRALVEARTVVILLREGDDLVVAATAGEGTAVVGGRLPVDDSTAGEILESRRARRLEDVEHGLRLPLQRLGIPTAQAALYVPLVYRSSGVGVLAAFDRLRGGPQFTGDDEELLRAFAASAATAVATAQNVESDRLRRTMEAAESERRRWARELHDETLQGLAALKVLLGRGAVDDALEHLTAEIANLRAIITDLRPATLDELGLVPALMSLVERTKSRAGLEVRTNLAELEGADRLPPEIETTVYRVVQEALTNVAKHAEAEAVDLRLGIGNGGVDIEVRDDGRGFDPESVTSGFGLLGMRERVDLAGGSLDVGRDDGQTVVRAHVPVR